MLKLIQLGLSFTDGEGNWAEGCTCWQFNFKFSLSGDMFAQDSIELLKTSGIDFPKFEEFGIDVLEFGELIMMSGLVLNDDVKWISFHSSYDFGYLVKTLTCSELPIDEGAFMDLLHTYFPYIYDVKVRLLFFCPYAAVPLANRPFFRPYQRIFHSNQYMMTAVEGMHGGLSALADTLQVERIGPMHQAGSDSLLTAQTFFAFVKKHLAGTCDDSKYRGELFGLGSNHTKYKSRPYGSSNAGSGSANGGSGGLSGHGHSQQVQYNAAVHYPQGPLHHSSSQGSMYGYSQDDLLGEY